MVLPDDFSFYQYAENNIIVDTIYFMSSAQSRHLHTGLLAELPLIDLEIPPPIMVIASNSPGGDLEEDRDAISPRQREAYKFVFGRRPACTT